LQLYIPIIAAAILIIWGTEYLPGFVYHPQLSSSIGPLMILSGAALGSLVAYTRRKGAALLGSMLLIFAAVWVWNLHYYFDPSRVPNGSGPPPNFYASPATLIILGIFFTVFFRYLYPTGTLAGKVPTKPSPLDRAHIESPPEPAPTAITREKTPLYRLALLACSAGLAVFAGRLAGINEPAERAQIIISILVFGCLATGLISEETLVKIIPWKK
jgi:hypothetical protein